MWPRSRYRPAHFKPILGRALLAAALSLLTACGSAAGPGGEHVIGVSTSLPLLWREAGDIRGQLADDAPAHWAMAVLARHGRVVPLDSLADGERHLPLPPQALLVLAQPRPLTPQENVALDAWVRQGGRLLLFADPVLTAHSRFALGDVRRPQDVVMLSPILGRWGLSLQFDDAQPAEERTARLFATSIPVRLAGRFHADSRLGCALEPEGIAVDCRIGKGRVIAVADAAVLDGESGDETGKAAALDALLTRLGA